MIKNYFKIAWRNLMRTKAYSFINISGLSIGLACCMLIILFTKDEVSFDRFHKNANNIYRITSTFIAPDGKVENAGGITGAVQGPAFKRQIPEIKEFVRIQETGTAVKIGTEIFQQDAYYVDDNFFNVFTFPLLAGDHATPLKNLNSVVISEQLAKKFFGTNNAVGKTIQLPKQTDHDEAGSPEFEDYVVTAVVPKSPQNSSINIQMLLPMKVNLQNGGDETNWMSFFLNTFVVLEPAADPKKVEAKFKKVYDVDAKDQVVEAREKYDFKSTTTYGLQPMLDMHQSTDYPSQNGLKDSGKPIISKILSGIALFILLIACINFVNLTVARSLKRAKEIGIRKVIGGERKQLIAQFLGESFLLSFFSFLLAIGLVLALLPLFNSVVEKELSFSYLFDIKLVVAYIALFIITSLLAGFYPALVLSGFNPVQTLYSRIPSLGKNYLSKGLVIFQFTLATFLIIATIVIFKQSDFLSHYDLGYNDKNIVVINPRSMKTDKLQVFKNELKKNPAIKSVAARRGGGWTTIARVDGNQIEFAMEIVDTSFLSTLGISIAEGRNLSSLYPSDSTQSVLVNEAFMKKAGWHDIKNKQVDFFYDSIKYNVVGVVKDYHYESLMTEVRPLLFCMNPRFKYGELLVKIDPAQASSALAHIGKVFKAQQPFTPYKYEFKDNTNAAQYAGEKKAKQVISFAAILCIFISCIGLFGLATLSAEKRTKEIGIRKVLGASVSGIAGMLSMSFLRLVFIAALIAFPAAWWAMNKWLEHYPYRIQVGVWVFVFAGLAIAMIALCTVSFQAVRKAIANPVKSLRTE